MFNSVGIPHSTINYGNLGMISNISAWYWLLCMVEYLKPNLIADKKTKPLCRCLALSPSLPVQNLPRWSVYLVPQYLYLGISTYLVPGNFSVPSCTLIEDKASLALSFPLCLCNTFPDGRSTKYLRICNWFDRFLAHELIPHICMYLEPDQVIF